MRKYILLLSDKFNRLSHPARLSLLVSALLVCALVIILTNARHGEEKPLSMTNAQYVSPSYACIGSCPSGSPTPSLPATTPAITGVCSTPPATPSASPTGKVYYVAQNGGSDSNSCASAQSPSSPKLTIATALTCLSAGDTLYIRSGTYDQGEIVISNLAGTSWNNPITIAGYPGEKVTLLGSGAGAGGVITTVAGASYLIFDNLILDGRYQSGTFNLNCSGDCSQANVSHHIRLQNSELLNSRGSCTGCPALSDGDEWINNDIHNCGTSVGYDHGIYMGCRNSLLKNNRFHDTVGYGVHMYHQDSVNAPPSSGVDNNTIVGNIAYNNPSAAGFLIATGNNTIFHNNISYDNNSGMYLYGGNNPQVYNNTIYHNATDCIQNAQQGAIIRNNICWQNGNDAVKDDNGSATIDHNFTSDPQLMNPPSDFHLKPGSAALTASDKGGEAGAYGNGNTCVGPDCGATGGSGSGGGQGGVQCPGTSGNPTPPTTPIVSAIPSGLGTPVASPVPTTSGTPPSPAPPPDNGGGLQGLLQQFLDALKQLLELIQKLLGGG